MSQKAVRIAVVVVDLFGAVSAIAGALGQTVRKSVARYRAEGTAGLGDRSSESPDGPCGL